MEECYIVSKKRTPRRNSLSDTSILDKDEFSSTKGRGDLSYLKKKKKGKFIDISK